MSKADEMFKKLGYEKVTKNFYNYLEYTKKENEYTTLAISFEGNSKTAMASMYINGNKYSRSLAITMQELQSINEKCKELRMDGEIEYGYSKIYGFKRLDYTRNSTCYSKYSICHLLCNKEKVKELRMDGEIEYGRYKSWRIC